MFGRRVSSKYVLLLSVLCAVACAAFAVFFGVRQSWTEAALLGVFAVWFAVDSLRAWSWQRK